MNILKNKKTEIEFITSEIATDIDLTFAAYFYVENYRNRYSKYNAFHIECRLDVMSDEKFMSSSKQRT